MLAAVECAKLVIAQINENIPVVPGGGFLRMEQIDAWVEHSEPLPELIHPPIDSVAEEIGRNVATLVEDGSTVQCGIGTLPEAIWGALSSKRDLGIWSEMVSDGVVRLIDQGVITGKYKVTHPRKVSASFALHNNPNFSFHPSDVINNPLTVGQQHKMVAINSALQVDLTGQVCSDSLGTRFYSGIGGQVDFIRGASMAPNGRPIIALRSTAKGGEISRIVATLSEGAGVVTSRGDVHYVVTEYGIADLFGKSIRDRALALLSVAHPDFRGELLAAAKKQRYVFADQIKPRDTYQRWHELRSKGPNGDSLLIRPLRETDEDKILTMFYSLSQETVRRRYLMPMAELSRETLLRHLRVDDRQNVALVVETVPKDLSEPEIVGVARYHTGEGAEYADVAFLLQDEFQGAGLGRQLFKQLIKIAKDNQLKGFTADVLTNNLGMLKIFQSPALEIKKERVDEIYTLKMRFL